MGMKVTTTCLQWSQPILPHPSSTSKTLASAISSPSSKRRYRKGEGRGRATTAALACRFVPQRLDRSALFGTQSTKLRRSQSCELWTSKTTTTIQPIRRTCSASLEAFSDEEFTKKIQELALKFQLAVDDEEDKKTTINNAVDSQPEILHDSSDYHGVIIASSYNAIIEGERRPNFAVNSVEPPWQEIIPDSSIERKANSVDLPLSLRIIKSKIQWEEDFREAREYAYCSVTKAFSSMVFMIRELQSFTLQMRELLFYEDLQGILRRVHREMHASFVWLFQQVFSHTPTLMVYVMILLANFTVYSMGTNVAIAAASPPPGSYAAKTEISSFVKIQDERNQKINSSSIKTFSVSSSSSGGKTTSVGGNNGGGGKVPPVASGMDGDGLFDGSNDFSTIVPNGVSQLSSFGSSTRDAESVSGQESTEEDLILWNSIVEEAERMQASFRDEALDHETMQRFASQVNAKIEPDDYTDYFRTDLLYQTGLAAEPNNALLLANYAQFLCVVSHDYDRAEEYFKRAIGVEPADAEAYSKYATFLWRVRNDLWGAEETFLEAISADPSNSYYAANYAHFLWNTGGEDTCFPLGSPETCQEA